MDLFAVIFVVAKGADLSTGYPQFFIDP